MPSSRAQRPEGGAELFAEELAGVSVFAGADFPAAGFSAVVFVPSEEDFSAGAEFSPEELEPEEADVFGP